ncbi:hypothetical protein NL676_022135 [Syzygium grande]|nr:hypothetical protein NL676_022135 [Syzygium grande]
MPVVSQDGRFSSSVMSTASEMDAIPFKRQSDSPHVIQHLAYTLLSFKVSTTSAFLLYASEFRSPRS